MKESKIRKERWPKATDCSNLVETLMEIRFISNPDIARDLWAGMIASELSEQGYSYNKIPQVNAVKEGEDTLKITVEKEAANSAVSLFVNEKENIKFILTGSELTFNCSKGHYIGWDKYLAKVEEVLKILVSKDIIDSFVRTRLRYISEYEFEIFEHVNVAVNAPSDSQYKTLEINLTREEGTAKAYVSISGLRERINRITEEKKAVSLFDVTVMDRVPKTSDLKRVFDSLNAIHLIEKESFFGMLKEEFIDSLNPRY